MTGRPCPIFTLTFCQHLDAAGRASIRASANAARHVRSQGSHRGGKRDRKKKMEPHKRLHKLRCLRDEIAAMRVVKCRMSHEQVVMDDASGLPKTCRFAESGYRRIGLCAPEVRAKSLGCSHTSARITLQDAISTLGSSNGEQAPDLSQMRDELVWLDNAIHLLDHRKGEAEKQFAEICEASNQCARSANEQCTIKAAREAIGELEALHDTYVERIGNLRNRVVAEIDELLGEQA